MCGLFGWFLNRPDSRVVPLAAVLAVTMDCRGGHSWGYWADGELKKGLGTFTNANQARNFGGVSRFMGHTRLASVGAKTVENAHPFHIGHIVGAHNGGIGNWWDLNKEYDRKFDVDSMHIFAHLDEFGVDNNKLDELHGYGAITWLDDRKPDTINLSRWNNGDLAIADVMTKDGKELGTVWASTMNALGPALEISGFKFTSYRVDEKKWYYSHGTKLFVEKHEIPFGKKDWSSTSSKSPKYSSPASEPEKPYGYWSNGEWHSFSDPDETKKETKKEVGEKRLFVKVISDETRQKLIASGFKVTETGNNSWVVALEKPITPEKCEATFPNNVVTMRRKCYTCNTPNVNTVRHPELNTPLCLYCTVYIDTALTDENITSIDDITKQWIKSEENKPDPDNIGLDIMNFLETGDKDTVFIPDPNDIVPLW